VSRGSGAEERKGILGGTFNPPHVAHLIVAHVVREALELGGVLLTPSFQHAFKGDAEASPRDRATMTELAVAGDAGLVADRIEIDRGGVSYTVDTLMALRQREPDTRWHLIIGHDNLAELAAWDRIELLTELAQIVVTSRGGSVVPGSLPDWPLAGEYTPVTVPALEISSSQIRERVRRGRSIRYWVPPAVEAYILEHGLYQREDPGRR
jgi:nicotinate-nucleotide adenylyltransferase